MIYYLLSENMSNLIVHFNLYRTLLLKSIINEFSNFQSNFKYCNNLYYYKHITDIYIYLLYKRKSI